MASFYENILSEHEEKINSSDLRKAAKDISTYHRNIPKMNNIQPLDYNDPAYCCAYMYMCANLHTALVTKYFRKMWTKSEPKFIMIKNKNINICCIGGGSGIEVAGIFKALAVSPSMSQRVAKVSVLEEHHGWKTYFESVMSNLTDEKVPQTLIKSNFKKEFIEVQFKSYFSRKVKKAISQADVVCIMNLDSKFSGEESSPILQNLEKLLKKNVLLLYIAKPEKSQFKSIDHIITSPNFKVVLGPLEAEKFAKKLQGFKKQTYGCNPHSYTTADIIGLIKTSKDSLIHASTASLSMSLSSLKDDVGSIQAECEDCDVYENKSAFEDDVCGNYDVTEDGDACVNKGASDVCRNYDVAVDWEDQDSDVCENYDATEDWEDYWENQDNNVCGNYDASVDHDAPKDCGVLEYKVCGNHDVTADDVTVDCDTTEDRDVREDYNASEDCDHTSPMTNSDEEWSNIVMCDRYTQTEVCLQFNGFENTSETELVELFQALSGLLTLVERLQWKNKTQDTCCFHNCC